MGEIDENFAHLDGENGLNYAILLRWVSSTFIVLSILSYIAAGIAALQAPDMLFEFFDLWMEKIHSLGLIGPVIMMTIAAVSAFPAELPAIACGATYGLVLGSIATWLTAMIGASVAFCIGRFIDPEMIKVVFGEKVFGAIRKRSNEKTGVLALFFIRLIPLFPFFVVNFGSGMSGMKFHSYLLATGAGIIPGVIVSNAIGAGLVFANATIGLIALLILTLTIFAVKIVWRAGTQ